MTTPERAGNEERLREALGDIPQGVRPSPGLSSVAGWNRYDTDDELVLHLWANDQRSPGGQSWDLRVSRAALAATPTQTGAEGPALREALRDWLIDQSQQAHQLADHPDGQPGDPGGYFDKGAAHMADATLTWISEWTERAAALRSGAEVAADRLLAIEAAARAYFNAEQRWLKAGVPPGLGAEADRAAAALRAALARPAEEERG